MSHLPLYLLAMIIFAGSGNAADVPFVFEDNFSDLGISDSYLLEEKSALSRDLAGIPPVSSPDDDYTIEVALITNKSINRSSSNNSTMKTQTLLSGLASSNQLSMTNATGSLHEKFATDIEPAYSLSAEALFVEGNENYNNGNHLEAIALYDHVIELNSGFKEVWLNKGLALCRLGRYQDAIDAFNQALVIDPDYSSAKKNRDIALKKTLPNSGEA